MGGFVPCRGILARHGYVSTCASDHVHRFPAVGHIGEQPATRERAMHKTLRRRHALDPAGTEQSLPQRYRRVDMDACVVFGQLGAHHLCTGSSDAVLKGASVVHQPEIADIRGIVRDRGS